MISFYFNYLFKGTVSKYSPIQRYWGLGPWHVNLLGGNSACNTDFGHCWTLLKSLLFSAPSQIYWGSALHQLWSKCWDTAVNSTQRAHISPAWHPAAGRQTEAIRRRISKKKYTAWWILIKALEAIKSGSRRRSICVPPARVAYNPPKWAHEEGQQWGAPGVEGQESPSPPSHVSQRRLRPGSGRKGRLGCQTSTLWPRRQKHSHLCQGKPGSPIGLPLNRCSHHLMAGYMPGTVSALMRPPCRPKCVIGLCIYS